METTLTYENAFAELEEISTAIQEESVTVDELALKLKRASELISFCQAKLKATEKEVNSIIKKMESSK